ncbi:C-X-C motif chemokine 17 [Carlito syrichta]|uniref:C-X-C motif chemokine 17 n=1 Tax=Carlito syrichta TaxID=1868482 RepID=A0A1U7U401_CARSF|nr:C-X-C motif chemokine 17 [Carlito syrichta]
MNVLISFLHLLLPLMLMSMVSSNPKPGVARGHRDQGQVSGRWLQEGGQECECKDWFLRAPKRKLMTVPRLPKKRCPCDHFKDNVKKTSTKGTTGSQTSTPEPARNFSSNVS